VQAADATPLVLVLNELVSNAAEHGFPLSAAGDRPGGTITVTAQRDGSRLVVHVEDDGQGMDGHHSNGLGTRIVESLVRTELNGSFVRGTRPEGGTRATIDVVLR
jgi:two-component sensor histidine kinase